MGTLTIVHRNPADLKPNPRNARNHNQKQTGQVADSIGEFGFNNPIVIDENNLILAGHARHKAAMKLGLSSVPTVQRTGLTEIQKRAYSLADNKIADNSEWDPETLQIEIKDIIDGGFDISLTGFDTSEADKYLDDFGEEECPPGEAIPEKAPGPTVARLGERYQLGHHVLVCGNAVDHASYSMLMGNAKAETAFTDPPYNVRLQGNVCGHGETNHPEFEMASGEMTRTEFAAFLQAVLAFLVAWSINGSIHYICIDWRHLLEMITAGEAVYSELKNVCIWNKRNGGLGSFYRSKHEHVFVWKSGTAAHINNFGLGQHGRTRNNVWDYAGVNSFRKGRMDELTIHPTVKPVEMVVDALKDCSRRGSIVLDPFCGSGTILIAAERTGRKARALEIDPAYVDVAIRRWQIFTGKDAVLSETGETFNAVAVRRAAENSAS